MAHGDVQTALAPAAQANNGVGPTCNTQSGQYGISSQLNLTVRVTAFSGGSSPTVTVSVHWSNDGVTWSDSSPVDTFNALPAGASNVKPFAVKAPFYRVVWVSSGTPTSITFGVTGYITR